MAAGVNEMTDDFDPEQWEALNDRGAPLRVRLIFLTVVLGVLLPTAAAIGFLPFPN
jgi:hypothetical protein